MIIKIKPADSRYERGTEGGQVTIRSSGHEALRDALIAARKVAGLTQAELALRLRCHQSFVARLESGERRVDVVELIVLARALQIDPVTLLAAAEAATDLNHRI